MKLKYRVYDPSKNITVLVSSYVRTQDRVFAADALMKAEPDVEQVGFVSVKNGKALLEMAGGEFCGNASRCASVMTGCDTVICAGQEVHCSGTAAYINKELKGIEHHIYTSRPDDPEGLARSLSDGHNAVGIMMLDETAMKLTPLVFVPEANTMFWENSCASGCTAVAAYLAKKYGREIDIDISQPGGIINVQTSPESGFVRLDGDISLLKEGELCIPELNY